MLNASNLCIAERNNSLLHYNFTSCTRILRCSVSIHDLDFFPFVYCIIVVLYH